MNTASQSFTLLLGRALLALVFLVSGAGKVLAWHSTAGYMEFRGIPWPAFFLAGAIALEIGGGLSVLVGWRARTGAWALAVFLVPATIIFHNFWAVPPDQQREQILQFLKNVSIFGGLLMVAVHGAGPWSLDARSEK